MLSINDNLNNMDNLENKKPKKKTKKVVAKVDGGGEKEHKEPWQKVYAKAEEIEQFLNDHIHLRRNVVTMRTEWREPSSYEDDGTEKW